MFALKVDVAINDYTLFNSLIIKSDQVCSARFEGLNTTQQLRWFLYINKHDWPFKWTAGEDNYIEEMQTSQK